jgi:dolichol-phosphate mannosyltransferase
MDGKPLSSPAWGPFQTTAVFFVCPVLLPVLRFVSGGSIDEGRGTREALKIEARKAKIEDRTASKKPALSVLMPVYNERATLCDLLERIRAVPVSKEILLVDDASDDGTRELIRTEIEGKFPEVRVFYHEGNLGKGAALRTIIPQARGEYCIVQDGDLEYNPEDYVPILDAFTAQNADAVYGSRFLHGWPPMRIANRLVNKLLAWMVRFFFRIPMTDEATCYKAFRTDILQSLPLTCRRFEFCPEVTAKAIRRGCRIVEVPIRYAARSMAEGKKIRWTDGVAAIWTLIKFRFVRF